MRLSAVTVVLIVSFCTQIDSSNKGKSSEVIKLTDIKQWKKELRTKNNVLVLFTKDSTTKKKLSPILDKVSVTMRGLATIILVNCGDASKMCKKLKVSPKPNLLHHYNSGEFNKVYDRKETVESMISFLKDPTGDIPWSEDEESKDVVHVDYQAFKRLLRKERLPILTMFYAPWCGHCKRMKPEFNAAATAVKGKAVLVGINADGAGGTAPSQELNVTSFPTILYFEKGEYRFKFGGERTKQGIVSWLAAPSAEEAKPKETEKSWAEEDTSPVAHLTVETFKPFLAEHNSVLVMFYAPWCGHCKSMKPEFARSALVLQEQSVTGKLAAVDVTTNRGLGDEFSVKGFPTVIYFKNGKKTFEHQSLRKEKDIVSFMKDPKEPPPPAPEEAPWIEQESHVVHLTDADFDTTVKRKKHALVMFYAPWCGHCKRAKPEFTGAAETLSGNNKVLIGAVDCTAAGNKGTCVKYGVKGYPTIIYLSYGGSAHRYNGGRDKDSFIKAMTADNPTSASTFLSLEETSEKKKDTKSWGGEVISHLSSANYISFVQDNSPVFILYYRSGCVTCESTQHQFTEAGKLLANNAVTLAALDCSTLSAGNNICQNNNDIPYLKLHSSDKHHLDFTYSLTTRDMYNFVLSVKDEL